MQGETQYLMVKMMLAERLAESESAWRGVVDGRMERDWSRLAELQTRLYGAHVDVARSTPRQVAAR
ncbi:MAG TPA: hypothetical protein VF802_03630 [Candidatus Limnocylindrales bacterium]